MFRKFAVLNKPSQSRGNRITSIMLFDSFMAIFAFFSLKSIIDMFQTQSGVNGFNAWGIHAFNETTKDSRTILLLSSHAMWTKEKARIN